MSLIEKLPDLNAVKGGFGERLAAYYSKTVFSDVYVLHDVLIDGKDEHKSQIDLIIIAASGIYVVEVKTFSDAKIYGDGRKRDWQYYLGGHRYDFYNPIMQNKKHVEYLKKMLSDFAKVEFYSVVLMLCDDCKVSNVNRSDRVDTVVCTSLPAMNRAMKMFLEANETKLSPADTRKIYDYIKENQEQGKEARRAHKEDVKAYRQKAQTERENRVCPYCKKPLVLRHGQYGDFYGCLGYPKCRYTEK